MTEQGPWPGRFVWHDLMTTDAARSKDFYCSLFDWQIQEVPMGPFTYNMLMVGPGPIGGIVEEKAIPISHWMPYVAVPSVDEAAERCKELGGSVCVPPQDIPMTGRFSVVGDPQGAYFSLYTGLAESPGANPDEAILGRVCWNELMTSDDAAAQSFYTAMFGWQDTPRDMGPMGTYHVQTLGAAMAGGIMRSPVPGMPSFWVPYFYVQDLVASTARAKDLGATSHVEDMAIEGIGRMSMIQDPLGATLALFAGL